MNIWLTQRAESTPHDEDGIRRYMRTGQMALTLSDHGHSVEWWTGDFDHFGRRQRNNGSISLKVSENYKVQYLDVLGYSKSLSLARLRYDTLVAQKFSMEAFNRSAVPDVIIASMPSIDLALASVKFGLANNIPVVVDIRDQHPDVFSWLVPTTVRPIMPLLTYGMRCKVKTLLEGCDAIWGITDNFVEWGIKQSKRVRNEYDIPLPMSYKLRTFTDGERKTADAYWDSRGLLKADTLKCIFIGTLSDSFNFKPIFKAAKILEESNSKVKFVFCGTGIQEDYVTEQCQQLSNCEYVGWLNAKELQSGLIKSDVGLAPYVPAPNYIDNMPNKPVEYLCGGSLVATSLAEGVVDEFIVRKGGGFSYHDAECLASELNHLAKNRDELTRKKDLAKSIFDGHFDAERNEKLVLSSIEKIVERYTDQAQV